MNLLIVEDDIDLGEALLSALRAEGFTCLWVRKLGAALGPLGEDIDCVLLDLTLPDGDGLSLLRRWRATHSAVPVIVITARQELEVRLAGLDSGADDFILKPFAISELVSRLWAVHRRHARQASNTWVIGELTIDPRAHQVWRDGEELALSSREFQLLLELARAPGAIVSKGTLGVRLEPLGDPVDSAAIEVHMSNLRRKIGAERIRTIRGVGYQLTV
ncbi:MAG: response regulator transcription factor [Steroidobacteraceae bacterium]|nr:response regulator transcription factor [Steroidobacteraceae bacterium]